MGNIIDTKSIGAILAHPSFSEMRFVIVSDEKEFIRGYISGDGDKLFECQGDTAESVFLELSEWCKRSLND
jgi:hypothetical protein